MTSSRLLSLASASAVLLLTFSCAVAPVPSAARTDLAQTPSWSAGDRAFFLHGSLGTEVVPERALRAFLKAYPDLFPGGDLAAFGALPDPAFGWPVGFSRREVPHLGGQSAIGMNCAVCHVGQVEAPGQTPVRVLGMTSHFDAEAFFGSVAVATFRTAQPDGLKRFLASYLEACDPGVGAEDQAHLSARLDAEAPAVTAVLAQPCGDGLLPLAPGDLILDRRALTAGSPVAPKVRALLGLFHNLRWSLHIPNQAPTQAPPASGPGRNDAFGLLSAAFFGEPQPYAPVKYGLAWDLSGRHWVHWDGNTPSPIGRNLLAALGLGAPLVGHMGMLDFSVVKRQTDLAEGIRAPAWPWAVDQDAAARGAVHYAARCASCHDGAENDLRLHAPEEVGTDPLRAHLFTPKQAERFNGFLNHLEIPGYVPAVGPGIRSTGRYWAAGLAGVWARSPYLHNGSVRTMEELLARPADRPKSFHRGTRAYDPVRMGYEDAGAYLLDTQSPGNGNGGHDYGTDLTPAQKKDLIEYLKTR